MASSPAGSSHDSHDNVEYRMVRKHLSSLVKQSQFVLTATANELCARELISTTEHAEAINGSQPTYNRATKVMGSVLTKIQHDCSCFSKLVEALREAEIESVANDLEAALSEEKACYVSPEGLQQNLALFSSLNETSGNVLVETAEVTNSNVTQGTDISVPFSVCLPVQNRDYSQPSREESIYPTASCSVGIQPADAGNSLMALSSTANHRVNQEARSSQIRSGPSARTSYSLMPRYSSPHLSNLSKSSQVIAGGTMELCVKHGFPLKRNPHIDACSELVHRPLRMVRSQRGSSRTTKPLLPAPQEENGSDDVFPIQNTEEPSEDSPSRHHLVKEVSVQSSCICHVKIQFLQRKLTRRMSQIEFLQHELEEIEKNFEEEMNSKSEALQKRDQMIAKRDSIIETLKTEIASRDKLALQLNEEIAEYEEEIDSLHQLQQNAEQQKWIAEEKARLVEAKAFAKVKENQAKFDKVEKKLQETEVKAQQYHDRLVKQTRDFEEVKLRAESFQAKIAKLEKELKESKQREDEWKQEFVKVSAETVRSEISADIQACVSDRNNAACSTWVPKLKILVERERKKAASEDDYDGVKVAGELAEKVERLLRVTETASQTKGSSKGRGYKKDISALDLETPDKDVDFLLW